MTDLKIVSLTEHIAPVNDIPARLRDLADRIERNEEPAEAVICIVSDADNDWPTLYNWGEYLGNRELLGVLELAVVRSIDLMRTPE